VESPDGAVEVLVGGKVVSHMGPKDFFGEIATFTQEERTASVVAQDPVTVLRLERSSLLRLLEELPGIAITVCEALSKLVSSLTDRLRKFESGQALTE